MDLQISCLLVLLCLSSLALCEPKHWAVLVAGSNGYFNYRHQADICHAYQILRRNGIPDERIIVMMYDDIAHNTNNPTPGRPTLVYNLGRDGRTGLTFNRDGRCGSVSKK